MKKHLIAFFAILFATASFAAVQYEADGPFKFNYGDLAGGSSILILADLESLTLSTDYGSVGNSAKVGYIVYDADGTVAARSEALFYKQLAPSNDIVLANLSAGQTIGFYLERNNGDVVGDFVLAEVDGYVALQFAKNGKFSGNSETFVFLGVSAIEPPQGQPLPGGLLTLLVGGTVIGGTLSLRSRLKKR